VTARLEVLRNRDFRLFLVGRLLATLAVQMQTVAVGWQVYSVTRDPLDLGLIGFSQFVPFIILILPAGQMADRRDRRRILTGCFAIECVCALGLLAFAVRGIDSAWPVFAVMFLFGLLRFGAMMNFVSNAVMTLLSRTRPITSGTWPPPVPSTW